MSKIAWVFPGQGAQTVGMGREMYETCAEARAVFEIADESLGFSLSSIIFEGPIEKLTLTENAQPALLTVGAACAAVLKTQGFEPDMTGGLSLGEYTALVVAGSLDLKDAVVLTHRRGIYMQEACMPGDGAMVAVLGLSVSDVEEICDQARDLGDVAGANYNCPGQIVVSGRKMAVDQVACLSKGRGAKVIPLNVSAPFHCALMKPAAERLRADLTQVEVKAPAIPVYSNVHGERLLSAADVRDALIAQVTMPVLWQRAIELMVRDGAGAFVEVGAGKTLTGFGKRTHPDIPYIQFAAPLDLNGVIALAKEALLR